MIRFRIDSEVKANVINWLRHGGVGYDVENQLADKLLSLVNDGEGFIGPLNLIWVRANPEKMQAVDAYINQLRATYPGLPQQLSFKEDKLIKIGANAISSALSTITGGAVNLDLTNHNTDPAPANIFQSYLPTTDSGEVDTSKIAVYSIGAIVLILIIFLIIKLSRK